MLSFFENFPGPTVVEKYSVLVQDDIDPDEDVAGEINVGENKMFDWKPDEELQPYYLRVYDISNAGILMSYFAIGMVSRITQTPVQYYLIEYLDASATIYSANNAFHRLPGTMKFLFGMLSDGVSILGNAPTHAPSKSCS
jgi:hypothetical protein